jgi:hypothetical protein
VAAYGDNQVKGRHRRLAESLRSAGEETGISAGVGNTDFQQATSLFFTRDRRRAAEAAGKQGKELPAVSENGQALPNLPLDAIDPALLRADKFEAFMEDLKWTPKIGPDVKV